MSHPNQEFTGSPVRNSNDSARIAELQAKADKTPAEVAELKTLTDRQSA